MLKESPFFSVITILGTALAICMIMVMVIVFEIQNKGFKPELNRDRTLYVKDVAITHKNEEDGGMNYSLVGGRVAKECFFTLNPGGRQHAIDADANAGHFHGSNETDEMRSDTDRRGLLEDLRFRVLGGKTIPAERCGE